MPKKEPMLTRTNISRMMTLFQKYSRCARFVPAINGDVFTSICTLCQFSRWDCLSSSLLAIRWPTYETKTSRLSEELQQKLSLTLKSFRKSRLFVIFKKSVIQNRRFLVFLNYWIRNKECHICNYTSCSHPCSTGQLQTLRNIQFKQTCIVVENTRTRALRESRVVRTCTAKRAWCLRLVEFCDCEFDSRLGHGYLPAFCPCFCCLVQVEVLRCPVPLFK
jgi:hypothetical protein